MQGLVEGNVYPAPGGVNHRPLEVYLIALPAKRSDPTSPESIPYCLIEPGEGGGGYLMPKNLLFSVNFAFFSGNSDGSRDDMRGFQYCSETHETMEKFTSPLEIGDWEFVAVEKGMVFKTFYGQGGEFSPPFYSVQHVCAAQIRADNCEDM